MVGVLGKTRPQIRKTRVARGWHHLRVSGDFPPANSGRFLSREFLDGGDTCASYVHMMACEIVDGLALQCAA